MTNTEKKEMKRYAGGFEFLSNAAFGVGILEFRSWSYKEPKHDDDSPDITDEKTHVFEFDANYAKSMIEGLTWINNTASDNHPLTEKPVATIVASPKLGLISGFFHKFGL